MAAPAAAGGERECADGYFGEGNIYDINNNDIQPGIITPSPASFVTCSLGLSGGYPEILFGLIVVYQVVFYCMAFVCFRVGVFYILHSLYILSTFCDYTILGINIMYGHYIYCTRYII